MLFGRKAEAHQATQIKYFNCTTRAANKHGDLTLDDVNECYYKIFVGARKYYMNETSVLNTPTNEIEMLLSVLELYQSDLKETENGIRKIFSNLRELEFISTMNEMDSVNAAIEKISSLSKGW
jgi:hypothetical protein